MPRASVLPYLAAGTEPKIVDAYASLAHRAREASSLWEADLVFVDVETTGFDPSCDRLIEIGAVRSRGAEIVDRFQTFVDPQRPLPDRITLLTGITGDQLAEAPRAADAVAAFRSFAGDSDLVGHNAEFDRTFLERTGGGPFEGRWLDSLELARIALPRMRVHRLADLSAAFELGEAPHRALADAEATFGLWRVCLAALELVPTDLLDALAHLAPDRPWSMREILAASAGRDRRRRAFDLRRMRTEAATRDRHHALPDAEDVDVVAPARRDVREAFRGDRVLGRMYPEFEPRDAQVEMAEAVLDVFGEQTHLAVEAGTGVGKSVAYLLPAALFATRNGIGVGVATRTNSLLDQLMYRELPALAAALAEDQAPSPSGAEGGPAAEPLRFVALKGYEHYPCLRKLDRLLAGGEDPGGRVADVAATLTWTAQSAWDDLDALNVHRNEEYRLLVTSVAEECAKRRCRFYPGLCYVHGIRQRAQSAHLVVTNHSLLFNDVALSGGILPSLRYWVVDEAHAAEDQARDQLSLRFSFGSTRGLVSALSLRERGSVLAGLRSAPESLPSDTRDLIAETADHLSAEAAAASTILASFAEYLGEVPALAGCRPYATTRVTGAVRDCGPWGASMGVARSLVKRLDGVTKLGQQLAAALEEAGEELAEQRAELRARIGPLAAQLDALATFVNGEDDAYVYVARSGRGGRPEGLLCSRLRVGPALAQDFFPVVRSTVFTSATLAVADDFSHFEQQVGLDLLPPEQHRSLRLDSPYDFENQMAVYVATDCGDPRSDGWVERVAALLRGVHISMGGSVLSLFTNRSEMNAVYDRIAGPLAEADLHVRIQEGAGSVKRLRQEFVADERLSLFATRSFWEGFDAPGDTLRCVVVAKLPFPNPSDPVLAELKDREPSGHFERHALPTAALDLKQAVGRLIRSSSDSGCVVITDSRLAGRLRYAPALLEALPVRGVEMLPAEEIIDQIARRFGR